MARGNFASARVGPPRPRNRHVQASARRRALPPSETVPHGREKDEERICVAAPLFIAGSRREPLADPVEFFQPAHWSETDQRRWTRAPAGYDPADRVIINRFDAPDDVDRIERSAVDQEMLSLLLATRRGALERHQQPCLHLCHGAIEFDGAQSRLEPNRLLAQRRYQLGRLGLAGAGVDSKEPGVAISVDKGVNGVDQPSLLPNLLEQAGRHAA